MWVSFCALVSLWLGYHILCVRCSVRLGSLGGCGLRVFNGFLHFAQAHLTVIGHVNGSGVGIDLQSAHNNKTVIKASISSGIFYPPNAFFDGFVFYSQFSKINSSNNLTSPGGFMLVTSNVPSQNRVLKDNSEAEPDIQVKSLT